MPFDRSSHHLGGPRRFGIFRRVFFLEERRRRVGILTGVASKWGRSKNTLKKVIWPQKGPSGWLILGNSRPTSGGMTRHVVGLISNAEGQLLPLRAAEVKDGQTLIEALRRQVAADTGFDVHLSAFDSLRLEEDRLTFAFRGNVVGPIGC